MIKTADWAKDAVFYQIFPDRFASSKEVGKPSFLEPWDSVPTHFGYKGGDLMGVVEKLDYLQDLGVNVLYFNPIFQSTANHRYHTHDYFRVDPILGGDAAFKKLIDAAHRRSMRVLIDGVFNHASRGFYQFNHTLENGKDSPYKDWFHFNHDWLATGKPLKPYEPIPLVNSRPSAETSLANYGYRAWWNIPSLPKFNTGCPAVREFIMQVGEYWLDFGIDGWRLDVPHEIDDDSFWVEFRQRVMRKKADGYIVGEIWKDAERWLKGDQFDAVTNYLFTKPAIAACFPRMNATEMQRCGLRGLEAISAKQLGVELEKLSRKYAPEVSLAQMNLLGSHDTPRVMTMASDDVDGVKIATALMYFYVGAPCIYYGDEIGMAGGHDPFSRWAFPWDKEETWNHELRGLYRDLGLLRHESMVLRRGDFENVPLESENCVLLRRSFGGKSLHFIANLSTREDSVEVPESVAKDVRVIVGGKGEGGKDLQVTKAANQFRLSISAQSFLIW